MYTSRYVYTYVYTNVYMKARLVRGHTRAAPLNFAVLCSSVRVLTSRQNKSARDISDAALVGLAPHLKYLELIYFEFQLRPRIRSSRWERHLSRRMGLA